MTYNKDKVEVEKGVKGNKFAQEDGSYKDSNLLSSSGTENNEPTVNVAQSADRDERENENATSVVRPHHHLKPISSGRDKMFKVRNMLNISFMLLTVIGISVYYSLPNVKQIAIVIVLLAVTIKIVEVFIRIFHK